jgi:hypothetical protein
MLKYGRIKLLIENTTTLLQKNRFESVKGMIFAVIGGLESLRLTVLVRTIFI